MNIVDIPMIEPSEAGKIAFARMKIGGYWPTDAIWDIYTINANGTDLHQLTQGTNAYTFEYSPDGRQIAYRRVQYSWKTREGILVDPNIELWVMNTDGTNPMRLDSGTLMAGVQWTPDGKQLVYAIGKDISDYGAYIINADGSGREPFPANALSPVLSPLWKPDQFAYFDNTIMSPDRAKIVAIAMDDDGRETLQTIATDDLSLIQSVYAQNEFHMMIPAWSPDSREIAFVSLPPEQFWSLSDPESLHVLNLETSDVRKLIDVHFGERHEVYPYAPVWSPDGSRIAFIGSYDAKDHTDDIYVIRPDGSDLRRVTTDGLPKTNLAWVPES